MRLVQASLAATGAWAVATELLGHRTPIFSSLSAIIVVSTGAGRRRALTVELIAGVALGILIADLIVGGIGTGIWQIALVTLAAMVAAVGLGAAPMVVTQAAISAMLVVTVQPPGSGTALPRFLDAMVGGVIALAVTSIFSADPLKTVRQAADSVLEELRAVLHAAADALEQRNADGIVAALQRARSLDEREAHWRQSVAAGREVLSTAPREQRNRLDAYEQAVGAVDLVIRNVRVLVRGGLRAIELEEEIPSELCEAMHHLAEAVCSLGDDLEHPETPDQSRRLALLAAAEATEAHDLAPSLAISTMAGQIRSTAVDLLRGLGEVPSDARAAVRAASD